MDADLQDPPEVIPELVAKWREGFEVVYAVRKRRHGERWLKRVTAGVRTTACCRSSRSVEIPVDVGDFRLVDRRALDTFRSMRERNRYVRGMFSWVGFRQIGVPYERAERYAGDPKYSYRKSLRLAIDGLDQLLERAASPRAHLRLLLLARRRSSPGSPRSSRSSQARSSFPAGRRSSSSVTFLGGIQLMVLGMMGLYVARIYDEVKSRPLYVIREAHGLTPGAALGPEEPNPLAVIQRR